MAAAIFVVALVSDLCCPSPASARPVPLPAEQVANVLISGRSFHAIQVDVANVGQSLPPTLATAPVSNTDGFDWYVSRHYALKTDVGDKEATGFLELLECAYPYYAWFFGAEPSDIAHRRLPVVYGKEKKSLAQAMDGDAMHWDFNGGGITSERLHVAYAYPSGTLTYHHRYILLHECTHLFQMCLTGHCDNTPFWFCEGIADGIASHVYDERAGRVTLEVFDKATPPNFLDDGLETFRQKPQSIREIDKAPAVSRGVGFLLVHFLRNSPQRQRQFRRWATDMMNAP